MPLSSDDDKYKQYEATRKQSPREQELVHDTMKEFSELQTWRNTFAAQWEESAELVYPTSRNTFWYGNFNWPGMKKTDRQIDATGMSALARFSAILDSMLTPRNMIWQQLRAEDDYVMKDRATRLWFEDATRILFKHRYNPISNFASQNQNVYTSLGAFGTGAMYVEEYYEPSVRRRGLRYINVPLGELFIHQNFQGVVDGFIRWYRLTARQAAQKFGLEALPPALKSALEQQSEWPFNFLHRVYPRADCDPQRLDGRGKPWMSLHVSIEGQAFVAPEGGYRGLPVAVSRYIQTPMEVYGRGPTQLVLPALKTVNAEKRTFLKAGHRAADPVLLLGDDGLMGMSLLPGAMNKGGMTADGKPLVGTLPVGQIQITKEMMDEERALINDAFLVTLFQILTETPSMTATEVIERVNEKGILMAPTVGRQDSEYLGPMTIRELDCLSHMRLLPPMPPRLREAGGEYQMVSTSPLARAMRAQNASGFMRTVESVKELVQITGDTSLLHPFNFKVAIPAIADIQMVPESWMASPDEIAQKDKALADSQQRQQQIQAAPAQAAMMKAQAVQAKAGMGQQQPQQGQPQQQPQQPMQGGQ
jgi:Bacteriophage head to tail connecting protein